MKYVINYNYENVAAACRRKTRGFLVAMLIACPVIFVCGIMFVITDIYDEQFPAIGIFLSIFGVAMTIASVIIFNRNVKLAADRFVLQFGNNCRYEIAFEEDGVSELNLENGNTAKYLYSDMQSVSKSKDMLFLNFRYKLSLFIPKADVGERGYEEITSFLAGKGIAAK